MRANTPSRMRDAGQRQSSPLAVPSDLPAEAVREIADVINPALADVFALYLKTKNFHWHMTGPHFREYHKLLDRQASELLAMTDPMAERVRKIGGPTIKSIGQVSRLQRIEDNDADFVDPYDMLTELCEDNRRLAASLREAHRICEERGDVATTSLIEQWIDETEERTWFLYETCQREAPAAR